METITVIIKLYSGIEKELKISDYDVNNGISLTVRPGTTLRSVLRKLGLKKLSQYMYFSKGHHISLWKKIYETTEVSCLKISGGG